MNFVILYLTLELNRSKPFSHMRDVCHVRYFQSLWIQQRRKSCKTFSPDTTIKAFIDTRSILVVSQ